MLCGFCSLCYVLFSRIRHLASLGAGPSGPLRALRARCGPSGPAVGASRPQGSLPGCLSLPGYPAGPGNLFARLPFYPAPTRLFRVARKGVPFWALRIPVVMVEGILAPWRIENLMSKSRIEY